MIYTFAMTTMMKLMMWGLIAPSSLEFTLLVSAILSVAMNLCEPFSILVDSPGEDMLSLTMIYLGLGIIPLMVLSNTSEGRQGVKGLILKSLIVLLTLSFLSGSLMEYYFFFECSVIPIFLVIIGWGYQPERFSAGMFLLFYTLFASLPMLLMIIKLFAESGWGMEVVKISAGKSDLFSVLLCAGFLVKLPMYGVHLWLPKAHVEAPVSGSMILAGVLLKLGGYGLIRVSLLASTGSMIMISMFGLFGGAVISLLNCQISDMKVLIAYSSVVHMAMIIIGVVTLSMFGMDGAIWMMVAHGFISSAMFSGANMFYERAHSRSLMNNKGVISWAPSMAVIWFLLMMFNFGGPFTLNLFAEIGLIYATIGASWASAFFVGAISFFSAAYSLVLYASVVQGVPAKWGGVEKSVSYREMTVLIMHIWPCVLLLGDLTLIYKNSGLPLI